jgi:hypothetical protein
MVCGGGFGGDLPVFGGVFLGCYRAHAAHLPVHEEPATMLLVLERFFQQSWHTMIQPRVLWLAPRVLVSGPPLPHSAHVPMSFGLWVGWLIKPQLGRPWMSLGGGGGVLAAGW